ncbi:MAG: hypothetical protein KGI26_03885 [Thaumarchaeota archaeon]|nr:hypothetical protein [Nitrososphaerota archaeon]
MILFRDAVWNLVTGVFLLGVLLYAYRLHAAFKGGAIRRAYTYMLVALAVMCASFLGKVPLNLYGTVDPLASYGITYTNFGVLVGAVFLLLSVRELAKFWRSPGA